MMNKQSARQQTWNQRYQDKPDAEPGLPDALSGPLGLLKPGKTLDLACGDGAAALQLARLGHQVTAIDFAEQGLQRLRSFACAGKYDITTICMDLTVPESLLAMPAFDNIVVIRYKPETEILDTLHKLLKPGGQLIIATFNHSHHHENGFPERLCLKPYEYNSLTGLILKSYSNGVECNSAIDIYRFMA